jgi:hypothetical protein
VRAHIDHGRLLPVLEDYSKAGEMFMDIEPAEVIQQELFPVEEEVENRVGLMSTLDAINARCGRGSLKTGSIGFHERDNWYMRQERKTQFEDRPRKIKMELFPADDIDVDTALGELEKSGFLTRYEILPSVY